jgi:hypothetical protein
MHGTGCIDTCSRVARVRATLRGIRRTDGAAPAPKAPVLAETARAMALAAPDGIKASATVRCYCWGFAGAFRSISRADLTLLTGVLMFGLGHRGTSIASAGYRIAQGNPSRTEMPDFVRRLRCPKSLAVQTATASRSSIPRFQRTTSASFVAHAELLSPACPSSGALSRGCLFAAARRPRAVEVCAN